MRGFKLINFGIITVSLDVRNVNISASLSTISVFLYLTLTLTHSFGHCVLFLGN